MAATAVAGFQAQAVRSAREPQGRHPGLQSLVGRHGVLVRHQSAYGYGPPTTAAPVHPFRSRQIGPRATAPLSLPPHHSFVQPVDNEIAEQVPYTTVSFVRYCVSMDSPRLRLARHDGSWALEGVADASFALVGDYLSYLRDRAYSPHTVEAYAFDLLHFVRFLNGESVALDAVTTEVILRYLAACRLAPVRGRYGGNVYSIRDGRNAGFAATTINRRLIAISGLFSYREMLDPDTKNPVPRGREARRSVPGERTGELSHLGRPQRHSRLRLREPRRLPRALDGDELRALIGSFRTDRDRAIASLMVFSGLRSAEVLALSVHDVDIGGGWIRVLGKGDKERRVPLDPDVASLVQTYLLAERPETFATALFVVAKGPNRGEPLTRAGLRAIFRYHREKAHVPAGHPHALRHSFGTALAEAGVDLAVIQALMGHNHVDSAAAYIHLAPTHLRSAYDAARARQRSSV